MTRITTVEELDALPDYSPVRIHIVGTNQWLEGYGYATRSPNGFWWVTGQGRALTADQLIELANGGIESIFPETPELKASLALANRRLRRIEDYVLSVISSVEDEEHIHDDGGGQPDCPACWRESMRYIYQILRRDHV